MSGAAYDRLVEDTEVLCMVLHAKTYAKAGLRGGCIACRDLDQSVNGKTSPWWWPFCRTPRLRSS